jgi:hypothetical protein
MKGVLLTCFRGTGPAAVVLATGVVLHLLFLVSLRTGRLNPLFNDAMHRFGPGCDIFSVYATACFTAALLARTRPTTCWTAACSCASC